MEWWEEGKGARKLLSGWGAVVLGRLLSSAENGDMA